MKSRIKIKVLPADEGDCILIKIYDNNEVYNVLVDGGTERTYNKYLKNEINDIIKENQKLDFIICTHIDNDHIGGLIAFLQDDYDHSKIIDKILFNGYLQINESQEEKVGVDNRDKNIIRKIQYPINEPSNISTSQGTSFSYLTLNKKLNVLSAISGDTYEFKDININILAPSRHDINNLNKKWNDYLSTNGFKKTFYNSLDFSHAYESLLLQKNKYYKYSYKENISTCSFESHLNNDFSIEDKSITNKSSIVFLLEFNGKKLLFLGDNTLKGKENHIENTLLDKYGKKIIYDVIKLPHHGSSSNISKSFIDKFVSKNYICSTNGKKHKHPHLNVITNILNNNNYKGMILNYEIKKLNFLDDSDLKKEYNYNISYNELII